MRHVQVHIVWQVFLQFAYLLFIFDTEGMGEFAYLLFIFDTEGMGVSRFG